MRAEWGWGRALAAGLALSGCGGERMPGAVPGKVEFWYVRESGSEFGACSDEPGFRGQISPSVAEVGDVFAYRVSQDGKTAHQQTCAALDATSCRDSEPPLVFSVSGTELQHAVDDKQPIGRGACNLLVTQNWTLWDEGPRMSVEISNALSLVDAPAACESVDAAYRQQSPNGLGLQGCVFSWKLALSQDPPPSR
ncbi:MAG: hypothetical protein FJ086_09480 [Deltaproteobacteria bacterium]|nr:hypothetical protein [Deltaproteobacteria bacterium]